MLMKYSLNEEQKTIEVMVKHYCKQNHQSEKLCDSCKELLDFAYLRLSRCPFKANKPNCQDCTIHCYKGAKDKQIEMKNVMRQIGPQMIYKHPFMAFKHIVNKIKI